jgi:hypothetical protein
MAVKQRQSQKQNVNVTVNLGEKKKKGKPKKRKTGKKGMKRQTQIIPAFNPPPIINYPPMFNQKPNTFLNPPPPIPQKEYSVFPEAETAPLTNILSTVPTILKLQTTEPEPNLAKARAKAPDLPTSAPEADTSPFVTTTEEPEPTFYNAPETTTNIGGEAAATLEPVLAPAEDISIQNALQYILNLPELPVGLSPEETQRKEEEAREKIAKLGARFKAKKAAALPVEPPSPSSSSISSISYLTEEPPLLGVPSQSFYNVGGLGLLPPLNLGPRQQIKGAEKILGGLPTIEKYIKPKPPKNEPVYDEPAFLFTEGLTGRTITTQYSAPLTASSLVPTVAEAKEEASTQLETKETKKKKSGGRNIQLQKASLIGQGFATGGENLPKPTAEPPKKARAAKATKTGFNPTQTALAFPAPIAQANDIPSNITGLLGLSIAEQPLATYIIPEKPTFELASSKPPLAPITGGIQRRRGAALTPAEEDILLKQPVIPTLFTQRSQSTL